MIGFALRAALGGGGDSLCGIILGSLLAVCAICGLYKCSQFRMRDCPCCKRWMRATGADAFDDFNLTVLVHEAQFTSSSSHKNTAVRLRALDQQVETDPSHNNSFHQHLEIFIAQGTEELVIELIDTKKVLAVKKLDVAKEVYDAKTRGVETWHTMKQLMKGVLGPKIKLTFLLESDKAMEEGLMSKMNVSQEASAMIRHHLTKERAQTQDFSGDDGCSSAPVAQEVTELDLCLKCCTGPLEKYGSWGSRTPVYVAAKQRESKFYLFIWKTQQDHDKGVQPEQCIDLKKITSVVPDPHPRRNEVFIIQYVQNHAKERLTFRRVEHTRDVWVEMLQTLIKLVREKTEELKMNSRSRSATVKTKMK